MHRFMVMKLFMTKQETFSMKDSDNIGKACVTIVVQHIITKKMHCVGNAHWLVKYLNPNK